MSSQTDTLWRLQSDHKRPNSSAACGADIIASEVASEIGLRRRIVLPFARDLFRETSANDRDVSRSFHFAHVMQAGLRTSGCGAVGPVEPMMSRRLFSMKRAMGP
jgi:hypothetical protein